MDQTGFKKQKHVSFTRFQGCFSQTWILVLLILLVLICSFWNWRKFWVKLDNITKWSISLGNFYFAYLKGACFEVWALFLFSHFVYNSSFGKIWVKIKEWFIRIKILISVLVSQIMVFHFVHFEHKKDFGIFWYDLSYIGFLFCLVDLIKAIPVSRPCNWTLMIFSLWFVMVYFG